MKVLKICEEAIFFLAILNLLIGFGELKRCNIHKLYKISYTSGYMVAGITLLLSFFGNIVNTSDNIESTLILLTAVSAMLLTFQISSFIKGLNSFFKVRLIYILQSFTFFILCEVVCLVSILCF